jgi:hypothetical protein
VPGADYHFGGHLHGRDRAAVHLCWCFARLRPLAPLYWPVVLAIIGRYAVLTHVTKAWFVRWWGM